MAKITIELEEVTEPQVFKTPQRMLVWSLREGKACDFCVRDVVAILPPLPNHANVVCLNGTSLWWANHCAKLPTD